MWVQALDLANKSGRTQQFTVAENMAAIGMVKAQAKSIRELSKIVMAQHTAIAQLQKQLSGCITRTDMASLLAFKVDRSEVEAVLRRSDNRFETVRCVPRQVLLCGCCCCPRRAAARFHPAGFHR